MKKAEESTRRGGGAPVVMITGGLFGMLLCVALAVTPAFKMKFWNIGAEGQVLAGGLATAACMIFLGDKLSPVVLMIVMVAVSIVAGAVWGLIPAFFKALFN